MLVLLKEKFKSGRDFIEEKSLKKQQSVIAKGPVSANDTMHQQKLDEMIVANRRVKQKDIANALDI